MSLVSPCARAQGLGGLLNKAKDKASRASQPVASTRAAGSAATGPTDGAPPPVPNTLTLASQKQYANAAQADNRDWHENQEAGTYWHRRLVQDIPDVHIVFTWDDAAVEMMTGYPLLLWGACEDISDDLQAWGYSNQGTYFIPVLKKVKEIHFTTTTKGWAHDGDMSNPADRGYHLSFNPATGVLTAAISSQGVSSTAQDKCFSHWIEKNVK